MLTALLAPLPAVGQGDFPDVCAENPNNLVQNCQFNDQMNGWNTFVEAGGPGFSVEHQFPACDSPKCPALRISAGDWFIGGIYQQIPNAVPGATYWANVIWLVYHPAGAADGTVGRSIGIDPTGGTDPKSPNVVWSQKIWHKFDSCPYKICRELQVQTVAQNSTITLFVRIEDTWKNRRDEFSYVPAEFFGQPESFWVDDVGLAPVGEVPVAPTATPAPPTETPVPPTDTPMPPTEEPVTTPDLADTVVEPTPSPTPTATLSATPSPTPKRLPTITPTPSPTYAPSPTPRPLMRVPTPRPTSTPTPEPWLPIGSLGLVGGVLCIGGLGLLVIVVLGGVFIFWLYRMNTADLRKKPDRPPAPKAPQRRREPEPGEIPPADVYEEEQADDHLP
jgi:hypothetical protein